MTLVIGASIFLHFLSSSKKHTINNEKEGYE